MHQLLSPKVMAADEAVRRFVRPGAVLGLGGQNINRCPMALVHEVIRCGIGSLTVVGCNLSLPLDLMVAARLVARTEQGSANLEKYGVLFCWRRAAERGEIEVADYSHLAMASRFLAASLGLPFLPTRSLLGSDLMRAGSAADGTGALRLSSDPWDGTPVVLLRALAPDVSLIHAPTADANGNVLIDGVTSHEVDMAKASRAVIVSAEEVLPAGALAGDPERVVISSAFVSAVVEEPFGAFPTSVYKRYDYYEPEIEDYQRRARASEGVHEYLVERIYSADNFAGQLDRLDPAGVIRQQVTDSMRELL